MISDTELQVKVHLYQALPKGEKLDFIIQKSVECGAYDVTLFESERCVVKVKADAEERKTERRRKIALEAAKQCGRSIIPDIHPTVSFDQMLTNAAKSDLVLFCYEGEGTEALGTTLKKIRNEMTISDISIIIGSEGGFSKQEAMMAKERGFMMSGLGKRILRAETAAIVALASLVYEFELS
jgi:16S rRNA (uracil1498-N3)-methyltransferase